MAFEETVFALMDGAALHMAGAGLDLLIVHQTHVGEETDFAPTDGAALIGAGAELDLLTAVDVSFVEMRPWLATRSLLL